MTASPRLFGGIPATGAIARTATNIRAGARSPLAGMIHALTLLAILLVAAPLAGYIPLAALAGILAYTMGHWNEIGAILRLDIAAISVWLATFALTVFAASPWPLVWGWRWPRGCTSTAWPRRPR